MVNPNVVGFGNYNALLLSYSYPKDLVAALLPEWLKLGPLPEIVAPHIPEGEHPVIFTFGAQKNVHPAKIRLFDWNYLETSLNVPCARLARCKSGGASFFYSARIYLTNLKPLLAGLFYGLPKKLADVGMDDGGEILSNRPFSYIVNSHNSADLIASCIGSKEEPLNYQMQSNQLEVWESLLNQEVISRTFLLHRLVRFPFVWNFSNALICPVTAKMIMPRPYFRNLPTGELNPPPLSSTHPLGAFQIITSWSIGNPLGSPRQTCNEVAGAA